MINISRGKDAINICKVKIVHPDTHLINVEDII